MSLSDLKPSEVNVPLHSSTDRCLQSYQIKYSFSVSFSHLILVPGIVLIGSKGTEVRNGKFSWVLMKGN